MPGESLPSLLARLMLANRYDPPRLFTGFCTQRLASLGICDSLGCPTQPQTFEILATLTGTTVEQLASASIHRFAPRMNLMGTNQTVILLNEQPLLLIDKNLRDDFRAEDDVQYCPLCLAEAAYHRLGWFPEAVAICLNHRCFLLEDCWQCGKRLNMVDLVKRHCDACEADLATAPPIPIRDDSFGVFVQEAISSWLGLSSFTRSPEWGLPDHPPEVLWCILFGLYSSLENRTNWNYLYWSDMLPKEAEPSRYWSKRYLKPTSSYVLYATAFKGLVDWPNGFYDFLSEYRAYTTRHYRRFDGVGLDRLAYRWLEYQWRLPEFEFVQEAYRQFIEQRENDPTKPSPKRPELSRRFEYMTVERAADALCVNDDIIYRLIQAGKLTSLASKASLPVWVRRRDVALIFDSWRQSLSPDRAGRVLGIPPEAVIDLAKMGFFITERGPIAADGSEDWLFNWQSVIDFMGNETFKLPVMNKFDQYRLDLISASDYMKGFGVTVASLIAGVVTGTLQAFREDEFDERFDQWIFLGDDLDQLAQMIIEGN
ncbi:MAG: TniQ family protein [Anaerolineales bacterium]|nr:TniQ family protein [Anaerolineales bacterium]